MAQAGLGQYEEALLSFALCVALDKYAVGAVKLDVAKVSVSLKLIFHLLGNVLVPCQGMFFMVRET